MIWSCTFPRLWKVEEIRDGDPRKIIRVRRITPSNESFEQFNRVQTDSSIGRFGTVDRLCEDALERVDVQGLWVCNVESCDS